MVFYLSQSHYKMWSLLFQLRWWEQTNITASKKSLKTLICSLRVWILYKHAITIKNHKIYDQELTLTERDLIYALFSCSNKLFHLSTLMSPTMHCKLPTNPPIVAIVFLDTFNLCLYKQFGQPCLPFPHLLYTKSSSSEVRWIIYANSLNLSGQTIR